MAQKNLILLSSLVDDEFAPDLIKTIDENVANGTINADVTAICNKATNILRKREDLKYTDEDFFRRLGYIKNLKNIKTRFLDSDSYYESGKGWKIQHDEELAKLLSETGYDFIQNLGYMLIVSKDLRIINLHPGIPEVGPIGMYPDVMQEQALRALFATASIEGIEHYPTESFQEQITERLNQRFNKVGGMLHFLGPEPDRGRPVVSYYEFALESPELIEYFVELAKQLRLISLKEVKRSELWQRVAGPDGEIRKLQYPGENPLILTTYDMLTHDRGRITDTLEVYEDDLWTPKPDGYNMNKEVGQWLRERNIPTLIS